MREQQVNRSCCLASPLWGDFSLFLSDPSAFSGSLLSPLFVALCHPHIPAFPLAVPLPFSGEGAEGTA